MKPRIHFCLFLLLFLLVIGCKSGVSLITGNITGPLILAENSSAEFSINVTGDTSITYQWVCVPASAGSFENWDSAITTFHAGNVSETSEVSISVTVTSDSSGPVVKSLDIEIRNTADLGVSGIDGPSEMPEFGTSTFTVEISGGIDYSYLWTFDPETSGTLTNETSPSVWFSADEVRTDTPVRLSVDVSTDDYGPVTVTHDLVILDMDYLTVTGIEGQDAIYDGFPNEYSVTVGGDSGIQVAWECDPAWAGDFTSLDPFTVEFVPVELESDMYVTLTATASSDNYSSLSRSLEILVRNQPEHLWAFAFRGPGSGSCEDIATDSMGNVYVTGNCRGLDDIDPKSGYVPLDPIGNTDVFLIKYSPDADLEWGLIWGNTTADNAASLVVDGNDNIYVTGYFYNTVDFNPDPLEVEERTSSGEQDCYVVKFDQSGNFQWVQTLGGVYKDIGLAIEVDTAGNVYVLGSYEGTVDFDPGPGVIGFSAYGEDLFLTKYSPDGQYLWTGTWTGSEYTGDSGLTVSDTGRIHVCGEFNQEIDLNPAPGSSNIDLRYASGNRDAFLTTLDLDGNYIQGFTLGLDGHVYALDAYSDNVGNIYLGGMYQGTVDFDPGPGIVTRTNSGSDSDCYIVKFDPTGNFVWLNSWGGITYDRVNAITGTGTDRIYSTGFVQLDVDFDPGDSVDLFNIEGDNSDAFLSCFNSDGTYLWNVLLGGDDTDKGLATCVDTAGDVYFGGYFRDQIDLNIGPAVSERTSSGTSDGYIVKVDPH